jgi:hypothetical protein
MQLFFSILIKTSKLVVQTLCLNDTFGDPNDGLFEPTLSWLNWLMKVYQ